MSLGKNLLVVDDDADLRRTLGEQLREDAGFTLSEAGTAGEALELCRRHHFDLAILDVGLPDMDGRKLCQELRRAGYNFPVIMLTAAASDADTIAGLEAGANDYVVKPFRFPVLLARIRAHLRQYELSEDAVFAIGPYSFRPGVKMLTHPQTNRKIRLTEKETAILKYLKRAEGRPVPRDVLLNEVWGYNAAVTTHTLETHIYRLRQKIEENPSSAQILLTEGGGYRLA